MQELVQVRQIPGNRKRRWFYSDDFDLIVWFHQSGSIAEFELCYNKKQAERSLVWRMVGGFTHMAVDDGEAHSGKYKRTPILVPDGYFDANQVHAAFAKECASLPKEVATHVLQSIAQHSSYWAIHSTLTSSEPISTKLFPPPAFLATRFHVAWQAAAARTRASASGVM